MSNAYARLRYLSKYWLILLPVALIAWFDWRRHLVTGLFMDGFIVAMLLIAVLKFVVSKS
jgi:predicted lysophospholipase L1 biosynthesis ABC-type transport system permease subunit